LENFTGIGLPWALDSLNNGERIGIVARMIVSGLAAEKISRQGAQGAKEDAKRKEDVVRCVFLFFASSFAPWAPWREIFSWI
jgi:hypothetical protein